MSTDVAENHRVEMETEAVESDGVAEVYEVVKEEAGKGLAVESHEEVENDVRCGDDSHVQLVQMVVELKFENEYLKAQFEGLKSMHVQTEENFEEREVVARDVEVSEVEKELREKIEALNREILDKTQTQVAAEDALKHLQAAYFDADERAQELSSKLAEAQQKMEQEIKERDDKYNELDAKLGRLHKRAKQRIQDTQKEKDDLEVRVRDLNEMSERASSQQSSLQQELERTRQQTKEALRAIDVDRQQLRSANTKLRDSIEEVNRMLETKENALEGLQRSLLEKEQIVRLSKVIAAGSSMTSSSSVAFNRSCLFGFLAKIRVSWTDMNPARKFVNCGRQMCDFWLWLDPEMSMKERLRLVWSQFEDQRGKRQS